MSPEISQSKNARTRGCFEILTASALMSVTPLVKRSVCFCVTHSLIEQVSEVIKQGVLLINF